MDGVALDRARPDDRDLDDQVVQALRPRLRQRLHLGPALDLEDAHRVGRLEHGEDLGDVLGHAIEIDADRAVVLDQLERLVHRREHPEAQQVQLDQLERLDVALVELDDDAVRHGRALDRGDVDQRRGGHQHPAAVDREMPREAVDPGAELEPALPVGQADGRAATGLGRRLGLDAGDRRVRRRGMLVGTAWRRGIPAAGPAKSIRRAPLGRSWRRFRQAALRVERPTLDQRGRQHPIPIDLVARPATGPQPGDAGRGVAGPALVVVPCRPAGSTVATPGPPPTSLIDCRSGHPPPPGARRTVAARSGPPAPAAGARAAPSRRAASACSAGPSRRRSRAPRRSRSRRCAAIPRPACPRPAVGRTRRTRRQPRDRAGPSRCRTSRAPSPPDRRVAAGTPARSPPRAPPNAPGT